MGTLSDRLNTKEGQMGLWSAFLFYLFISEFLTYDKLVNEFRMYDYPVCFRCTGSGKVA